MKDRDLIETLEGLLKQAKAGQLQGIAAALLLADNHIGMAIAGECWQSPTTSIGLLWQVQQELYLSKPLHATPG